MFKHLYYKGIHLGPYRFPNDKEIHLVKKDENDFYESYAIFHSKKAAANFMDELEGIFDKAIVHCKDCKYFSNHSCAKADFTSPLIDSDFCSRGARKKEDSNI